MQIVFRQNVQEWYSLRNFYKNAIMKNGSATRDYQLEERFMTILNDQIKLYKKIKDYINENPISKERDDHIMPLIMQLKRMFRQRRDIRRTILPDITFPKTFLLK